MLRSIGPERAAPKDVADHRLKRFGRQLHHLMGELLIKGLATLKVRNPVSLSGGKHRFIR